MFELPLRFMVKNGYLTPAAPGGRPIVHYDFSKLVPRENGLFSEAQLNGEIKRQERVTPISLARCWSMRPTGRGDDLRRHRRACPGNS